MTEPKLKPTFYGDVRFMPEEQLASRLKSAHEELNSLTQEIERREKFTEAEKLADRLHYIVHDWADCDYNYSHWPLPTGCRAMFLRYAEQALEATKEYRGEFEGVLRMLEAMRKA